MAVLCGVRCCKRDSVDAGGRRGGENRKQRGRGAEGKGQKKGASEQAGWSPRWLCASVAGLLLT